MKEQFTREALHEALMALTPAAQNVFFSEELNSHVYAIQNMVPETHRKDVLYLTTCSLLGLISPQALPEALTTGAGISPEVARIICASLNETVFPLFGIEYTAGTAPSEIPTPPQATSLEEGSIISAFRAARKEGVPVLIEAILHIHNNGSVSLGNADVEQALQKLWSVVSPSVKNTIVDQEYKHAVRNALLGHVLPPEEVAVVEEEVVMTLLGMQSKEEFATNLSGEVHGLTATDARTVANHIDERFFELLFPFTAPQSELPPSTPAATNTSGAGMMNTRSPLEQFVQTQEDVRSRFEKLPETVRETILSPEVARAFSETVRTYDLAQTPFLAYGKEAVRVMVGLATTKDFRTKVSELAIVPRDKEDSFAHSVEQGVFKPVRDAIIHALEERKKNG